MPVRTASRSKKTAAKKPIRKPSVNTDQKFWKLIYDENSVSDETLDKAAIIENDRTYTFRQFFRRWETCAEVFTGLGITEENHARLGVLMLAGVDSLSVVYGANMIGVSVSAVTELDLINIDRLIETIKKEAITDLIIDSSFVRPDILRNIMRRKNECGLNHVILVRLNYKVTKYFGKAAKTMQDMNYRQLKQIPGVLDMHALQIRYEATPFKLSTTMDPAAYIVHTSGTTQGIHKPIPLSDKAVNESVRRVLNDPTFNKFRGGTIVFDGFLSSAYHMLFEINMPLAAGCTVVILPLTCPVSKKHEAIKDYNVTILVTGMLVLRTWFYPFRDDKELDLSSLEYVVVGGEYVSGEKRKEFNDFIAEKGGHAKLAVGYGLSETGGAAILSAPGTEDDSIGYPMIGVKVRIQDETNGKFYDITDGPRSGGLYISSTSNSSGKIGDTRFFETETIDGEEYICTYDRVTVGKDGSLTCHGRMNRFFVNNEGIKFDAGLIEVSLSGEPGIGECAIVPEFNKRLHDTVPVLYVTAEGKGKEARKTVEKALYNVFVNGRKAEETNLPTKCVICEELPHNRSGKVDIFKIINDGLSGEGYAISAVRVKGSAKDVKLLPDGPVMAPGTVPQEMEEEYRKFTLPFFKSLEKMDLSNMGAEFMKPDFKHMMPMMGCNPEPSEAEEDTQNPYDAFRKNVRKPEMGCNPAEDDEEYEAPQNPYDGFRKPQMSCNPSREEDEDDSPSPAYNPTRFPFLNPRMGCNPFFSDEDEEDDD